MSDLPPAYDSIKELGVWDSIPDNIKATLPQLTKLPASVQEKAQAAMLDEATKPETYQTLMDEVKALGDSVNVIDQTFETVRVGLKAIDDKHYTDKDDFLDTIVPEIADEDMESAKADLKEFINRSDPYGNKLNSKETHDKAQKLSQEIVDLQNEMREFKDTFDKFADDQKAKIDGEISIKNERLGVLELEIKRCQTIVMAMGIALGVTVFATGAGAVGALAALGPLGPGVAIGIVIVGAIAAISELGVLIAYVKETNDKNAEYNRIKGEVADLTKALEDLKLVRASLMTMKDDIETICVRLDRFKAIWALVAHDAQEILDRIDNVINTGGSDRAFKNRIKIVKDLYSKLADALREYATNMGDKGPDS
ncbi:hypothetical protein CVT24_011078 [Panaeolus cyanescens]|uniref:Uncharacterized protein n=1 Tax=Panaeolus cyanescens TaxID=181874 RepID=A0A409YYC7_9AGAR|nr:hypothetical protein CVT24_011078 [Panaeolus cyanescens]